MSNADFLGGEILSAQHPDCMLADIVDTARDVSYEQRAATRTVEPTGAIGWCATQECRLTPDTLNTVGDLSLAEATEHMPPNCITRSPKWQGVLDSSDGN